MYGPHNHNIYSIGIKCRSRPKNTNWKGKNYFFYAGDKIPKIPQLKFIPADVLLGHWYLAKFSLRSQNLLGWYIFMLGLKSNVSLWKIFLQYHFFESEMKTWPKGWKSAFFSLTWPYLNLAISHPGGQVDCYAFWLIPEKCEKKTT